MKRLSLYLKMGISGREKKTISHFSLRQREEVKLSFHLEKDGWRIPNCERQTECWLCIISPDPLSKTPSLPVTNDHLNAPSISFRFIRSTVQRKDGGKEEGRYHKPEHVKRYWWCFKLKQKTLQIHIVPAKFEALIRESIQRIDIYGQILQPEKQRWKKNQRNVTCNVWWVTESSFYL